MTVGSQGAGYESKMKAFGFSCVVQELELQGCTMHMKDREDHITLPLSRDYFKF